MLRTQVEIQTVQETALKKQLLETVQKTVLEIQQEVNNN